MIKPRIIVTGATGKTGSVVLTELLKAGLSSPRHGAPRRWPQRAVEGARGRPDLTVADISDVERVAGALKDVQSAYYCPPYDPHMIQGTVAFAVAATEARFEHIVDLSQHSGFCPEKS